MVKTFHDIISKTKNQDIKIVAVAAAEDTHVLEAISDAKKQGICNAILVGDEEKIGKIAEDINFDLKDIEIINEKNPSKASMKAVALVSEGKADMVMKGLVGTADFLRAVLNKEIGLRTGSLMSHVAVFETPKIDRLLFLTDCAFNMYPDLNEKVQIINNAVKVAIAVGIEIPKVAPICAVEVVNPKMQATVDAAMLSKMNERGQIKNCIIDGPLAIDNALSVEAAETKGINSEVAGYADILLMPSIEAGNVMYKTLAFTTDSVSGGILVGTSAPVILTSRADSHRTKMNSIALAALVATNK
ncbi:phosphate butyryltransferase [Clostridium grantii]|uniref:Phosphate butyryltransferase n=1 Tax=Clostridium grantii DSM 8605 TaxID=1121316 RepID=A0A1M5TSQ8_9CLOT|nr:phosphate butyryltransferase [Clostridium grantii]SHH53680.1 phosphate butyryltransferase [Clostridium grantii DSM 8605]